MWLYYDTPLHGLLIGQREKLLEANVLETGGGSISTMVSIFRKRALGFTCETGSKGSDSRGKTALILMQAGEYQEYTRQRHLRRLICISA